MLVNRFTHRVRFFGRFGLEGLVTFKRENQYDADTYEITVPAVDSEGLPVKIGVFDKVMVEISVEKVSYNSLDFILLI